MNWKTILRWLAVLPSAGLGIVVGSVAVSLFGNAQLWFLGAGADGGLFKINQWVLGALAAGGLSVYWATEVAPSHKKITAAVVAAITTLVFGVNFLGQMLPPNEEGLLWPIVGLLSGIFGAGAVMHNVYTDGSQNGVDPTDAAV